MAIQTSFALESKIPGTSRQEGQRGEQEPLVTDGAICLGQVGVLGARGLTSPVVVYCLLVKHLLLSQCELGKTGISLTTNN